MIMLIMLSLLIFAFGRDFYKRINPEFIRQTEVLDKPQLWNINNKNFTVAVRLEDNASITINKSNAFYIEAEYRMFLLDENEEWYEVINYLDIQDCSEELFNSKENFDYNGYESWFCPVFDNLSFGGNDTFGSSIKFNFYICKEGSLNPFTNETCVTNDELNTVRSNLIYMSIAYQSAVVNPSNYYNGLMNKVLYDWVSLDPKFYKLSFNYFTQYIMITDYGWILEEKITESIIVMNKMNTDIIDINSMPNLNLLGSFWLYVNDSSGIENFIRKYVKIQKLAAEVGGIMNFFYLFLSIFLMNFNNHELLNKLIPYFYPNMNNELRTLFKPNENIESIKDITKNKKILINSKQIMEIDISKQNLVNNDRIFFKKNNLNQSINNFKKLGDDVGSPNINLKLNENKINLNSLQIKTNLNHNLSEIKRSYSQNIKSVYETFSNVKSSIQINPRLIKFIEKTENNSNLVLCIDRLYSKKSNSQSFIKIADNDTLDFVSYLFKLYICRCDNNQYKKANFLSLLHSLIEKEFDVKNFLKSKAEIAILKKMIFNTTNTSFETQVKDEIKYYDFLTQCLK